MRLRLEAFEQEQFLNALAQPRRHRDDAVLVALASDDDELSRVNLEAAHLQGAGFALAKAGGKPAGAVKT